MGIKCGFSPFDHYNHYGTNPFSFFSSNSTAEGAASSADSSSPAAVNGSTSGGGAWEAGSGSRKQQQQATSPTPSTGESQGVGYGGWGLGSSLPPPHQVLVSLRGWGMVGRAWEAVYLPHTKYWRVSAESQGVGHGGWGLGSSLPFTPR